MTSREIIRRVIRHNNPPRLGWDFHDERYQDIKHVWLGRLIKPGTEQYANWGDYPNLRAKAPHFNGELSMDHYGNILGRLNGITKGECVRGVIQEDWSEFEGYEFPKLNYEQAEKVKAQDLKKQDKYVLTGLPGVFSALRDMRRMENALMDVVAEPEQIEAYYQRYLPRLLEAVTLAADVGADGVIIGDDWGMQTGPFISPAAFRDLFKPVYKAIADACHARDVDFIFHSCGRVLPLVDDMIDAGIDCFQFDQPETSGVTMWAEQYGKKTSFYCPVDIQKIMSTGDRELIEKSALHMANEFTKNGGALIAKDYPTWFEIEVKDEWARWAMDVLVVNSAVR
ncbi:hypothetical protein FACS1894184_11810 [Clostridia bacterium]|nr:hypothetical protein FACS1894184_11810 [Clostridia bacterium]